MNGGNEDLSKEVSQLLERIKIATKSYTDANRICLEKNDKGECVKTEAIKPELFRCAPNVAEILQNEWSQVKEITGNLNLKVEVIPTAKEGVFALLSRIEERKV